MRILFFIDGLVEGGKERRLLELLKWLRQGTNYEMFLITMKPEVYYNDFYSLGIELIVLSRKGKYDFIYPLRIFKQIRGIKPQIIHSWGALPTLFSIIPCKLLKIYLIDGQIASAPASIRIFSKQWFINTLCFHFSSLVIANSKSGIDVFRAPKAKSLYIRNGYDFNRLNTIETTKLSKDNLGIFTKYVVGMVGSFSDSKDYETFFHAAISICKQRNDISFISIGTGKNYEKYSEKIVKESLTDRIFFLGKQEVVEPFLALCDIGVLVSYTEGISNALIEFMAQAKPVIATECNGNRELIQHGFSGILIPVKDSKKLEEEIINLLSDDELRITMGFNARNQIISNFNKSKMYESFVNIYEEFCITK